MLFIQVTAVIGSTSNQLLCYFFFECLSIGTCASDSFADLLVSIMTSIECTIIVYMQPSLSRSTFALTEIRRISAIVGEGTAKQTASACPFLYVSL